ncbi:hypothetical protein IZ6_02980 [Terrihabitans soli]|uniref:Uncharacterized protein n=1 Tax=Terrihabitans soli TaxID=708113 RepID=A0A6S6QEM3_9HYPH|nr:hypothetical protein [Terrihabitans soli]BCJ89563.1 hypothetical protein IZ6_02980 [Terrihabitans soli]
MPFGVAKNGMRMYVPTWQMNPGAAMKAANKAAADSYYANASALGGNFFSAMGDQTSGMMEITTKITTARLQADFSKKLAQAKAGLDVTI